MSEVNGVPFGKFNRAGKEGGCSGGIFFLKI
jgi:hypothetical protein